MDPETPHGTFIKTYDTPRTAFSSSNPTSNIMEGSTSSDVGTEDDFEVENNKFAFSPGQLGKLYNPNSLSAFYALGGLDGIERGLRTDREFRIDESTVNGTISFEDATCFVGGGASTTTDAAEPVYTLAHHKSTYNQARLPVSKSKSSRQLVVEGCSDRVLVLLTIAATITVALGLYETYSGSFMDSGSGPLSSRDVMLLISSVAGTFWVFGGKEKEFIRLNHCATPSKDALLQDKDSAARIHVPAELSPTPNGFVSSQILAMSIRRMALSALVGRLLPFLFFTSVSAQAVVEARSGREPDWRQRALGALQDNLVTFAFLLLPTATLGALGYVAHLFHRKGQQGYTFFGMLGTGVVFGAISKAAGADASENSFYMRIAIGVAYVFFMASFCRLIAAQQRWYKGRYAIAGGVAILLTLVGMAIPQIRSSWLETTKLDPLFAVLVGMPMSFALCDLVVYVVRRFGGAGGLGNFDRDDGVELAQGGGQRGPEQAILPLPVPGPNRT
jgi:hypothetical protein